MLTKFETKSNRVKGLSFHPTRPWILASLHNGVIQLWDYRIRTLIDKFDEHEGPVRGICFHDSQPLFVSGGDDYKIKVWNYKLRRCLFTLLGHLDYIRTVQYHHENPWILSASDDQTIRIWNWQSRQCISVLTGHNHYVMCAQFHPKENLVVSASLDQTVRVWDITGLKKKNYTPTGIDDNLRLAQNDLFGNTDVVVTHVLEGHDKGVNWASFKKNMPLIVSGADDRLVKYWRMSDTKAWEVDTLRGHYSNVSCVLFHPRQDIIISNSEDNSIRVWDMQKRTCLRTYRREHDRFWILAAHPEQNLFAAGHDSGLIVFKLEHERPAYTVYGKTLFYVKQNTLRAYDFSTGKDRVAANIHRSTVPLSGQPRHLHYNPAENAMLVITEEAEGNQYDLYYLSKEGSAPAAKKSEEIKGQGKTAVWVARNRFVVLDKFKKLLVKDLKNATTKTIHSAATLTVDNMFTAGTGSVLIREEDKVSLFDLQQKEVKASIKANHIKFAIWSGTDKDSMVALVGRDVIVIADKQLDQKCRVFDVRVKSGAWHENGVFIYTTLTHIKYCLPNGDTGIIRTLDVPIYITAVKGDKVFCLDRACKNRALAIDITEFVFKLALIQRNYQQVLKMVREAELIGQSIIAYLQRKGYPEVALHFVKDEKTRFNLAIECGNIDVALESAKAVDDKDCWHKLATEALRQGNHQVVEMAYQRTRNYERLSFLYLITGNLEKLGKMLKIAEKRGDVMSRFHNALYLGDVADRVEVLKQVGQLGLAYITASVHGLNDKAVEIAAKIEQSGGTIPPLPKNSKLLVPPTPIIQLSESNWPLLTVSKGIMETMFATSASGQARSSSSISAVAAVAVEADNATGWGDELEIGDESAAAGGGEPSGWGDEPLEGLEKVPAPSGDGEEGEGWDSLEIEGLENIPAAPAGSERVFIAPREGPSHSDAWRNSPLAVDHLAAGSFESAMQLLHQQIGAVNFAPLKPAFREIFLAAQAVLPTFSGIPSLLLGLDRNWKNSTPKTRRPMVSTGLQPLIEELKEAYKATTGGKFSEALKLFQDILHGTVFVVVETKKEATEVKDLIGLCRHYITGIQMELKRKDIEDPVRNCELAAYFTHCNLQSSHIMLSLRSAMSVAYKIKNYKTASSFAKRLLELNPAPALATQARKVIAFAEKTPEDESKLNYDERNPFVMCCASYTPIYKGNALAKCPFCGACYLPEHKRTLCTVCQVSEVGIEAKGLEVMG